MTDDDQKPPRRLFSFDASLLMIYLSTRRLCPRQMITMIITMSTCGQVVRRIPATDETRVRFPASALFRTLIPSQTDRLIPSQTDRLIPSQTDRLIECQTDRLIECQCVSVLECQSVRVFPQTSSYSRPTLSCHQRRPANTYNPMFQLQKMLLMYPQRHTTRCSVEDTFDHQCRPRSTPTNKTILNQSRAQHTRCRLHLTML